MGLYFRVTVMDDFYRTVRYLVLTCDREAKLRARLIVVSLNYGLYVFYGFVLSSFSGRVLVLKPTI